MSEQNTAAGDEVPEVSGSYPLEPLMGYFKTLILIWSETLAYCVAHGKYVIRRSSNDNNCFKLLGIISPECLSCQVPEACPTLPHQLALMGRQWGQEWIEPSLSIPDLLYSPLSDSSPGPPRPCSLLGSRLRNAEAAEGWAAPCLPRIWRRPTRNSKNNSSSYHFLNTNCT